MTATTIERKLPAAPAAAATARARPELARTEPAFGPVVTLILWTGCLAVGVIGLMRPYPRPQPKPVEQAIIAQTLVVELAPEKIQPTDPAPPPPDPAAPPPLRAPLVAPTAPPLVAVAEPTPAIAFALPVEGPARVVEAKPATFARPAQAATPAPAPAAVPRALTFGQGEGRQPAPQYPLLAQRRGQEGTVLIRFTVGEDGRVLTAEAAEPSPWPLLNNAAVGAVRERWRFQPGPVRLYEVAIRFELSK